MSSAEPRWPGAARTGLMIALIIALTAMGGSFRTAAQPVRADFSSFISEEVDAGRRDLPALYFGQRFMARVAGGVIFVGASTFDLTEGAGTRRLDVSSLALRVASNGSVLIEHAGSQFRLLLHDGLACPLARFTARQGQIAFTLPYPSVDPAEVRRLGLVPVLSNKQDPSEVYYAAPEFADQRFVFLFYQADFASVESLGALSDRLADRVNRMVDETLLAARSRSSNDEGSSGWYLNADFQVTYRVKLNTITQTAEISGVPLRYNWALSQQNTARITNVEVFKQVDGVQQTLSVGGEFSQFDVIVLYQAAAVFREFARENPDAFRQFVAQSCGVP